MILPQNNISDDLPHNVVDSENAQLDQDRFIADNEQIHEHQDDNTSNNASFQDQPTTQSEQSEIPLKEASDNSKKSRRKRKKDKHYPSADQIEAYWVERKRYLERIKKIPELRGKYLKALLIYLLRRFLWSFGFFPVFLSFWIPLVLARFNPVAMVSDYLPALEHFVNSNPEVQASTIETLFIAWFSIGFIFAVFDFVLTPFKSPYEYEADVHMRAWEELYASRKSSE